MTIRSLIRALQKTVKVQGNDTMPVYFAKTLNGCLERAELTHTVSMDLPGEGMMVLLTADANLLAMLGEHANTLQRSQWDEVEE